MSVEHGEYESEERQVENGTVTDKTGNAWLIIEDVEPRPRDEDIPIREILFEKPGRLRIHQEFDESKFVDQRYEKFYDAKLAYGLWIECGPFAEPTGKAIPREVATHSQAAIAAYLRVNNGRLNTRGYVADVMGIEEQTVANYCSKISWGRS